MSPGDTGYVRIWRSDWGQGHRSHKGQKFLFPQCKTSIAHNSSSIIDRAMRFRCNMGFSTTADQMVWPPSLSRDQKLPRVTKCAPQGTRVPPSFCHCCLKLKFHWDRFPRNFPVANVTGKSPNSYEEVGRVASLLRGSYEEAGNFQTISTCQDGHGVSLTSS